MARIDHDVVLGDRYRLLTRIATGGMGAVWEAEDTVLRRRVAVKVLSDSLGGDQAFVERFRREAQAAAGLSHPHVAGVFDYGEDGGTPFIVMELIEGENLAERMATSERLPPAEAARIAGEAAEALAAAHAAGVVHRDVKPGNIMLTRQDSVRVLDFGIAAASWAAPITATGTTLGTAGYLSPEQASGDKATPASDVYALGCVLYEMLTGVPPFSGDSPVALAAAHVREMAAPVSERAPDVPAWLAAACERALAKDPVSRPSAAAFAEMLRHSATDAAPPPQAAAAGAVSQPTTEILSPEHTAVLQTERTAVAPVGARPASRVGPWFWWILAALVAAAAVTILVSVLVGGDAVRERPTNRPTPAQTQPEAQGPTVPAVVGLRLRDAVRELATAGIQDVHLEEVPGERGIVLDVDPDEGSTLSEDEPVTLFVGNGEDEGGNGGGNGKDKGNGDGKGND